MGQWIELFRALGQSLADLARAELAALQAELERNGRTLAIALALLGGAGVVGFWLVALVLYSLIQVLAIWLPLWGASLIITGLALLVVAVLALIAVSRLKRLEGPAATVGRRWRDHREWWDRRLLAEGTTATLPPRHDGGAGDEDEEEEEEAP